MVLNHEHPNVWVLLLERVHQRHQVVVLVRHYDLVDVVQQHVARARHGPVNALVEGDLLTEVVHVPAADRVLPAMRRNQVLLYGPRNHLHEALLAVNPQQAVQFGAARIVVDHHPVHTEQSVHLQGLRELKHVVVVVKHSGDAHGEVKLQHFPFVCPGFDILYGEPCVFVTFRAVPHKCDVCSLEVLGYRTHDVCSHVGEPKGVRVH